ncbi:hypothetical protein KPH14_006321 [Odynerus spinipes]|uniref:Peptide deformylase n=1 Tax=Odynerus spinipes TaxID=1348599 RepID=A0AAD9VWB3_9HYME|nr:hypothetical protein KPH14_006321 [Odynerus spinipes]
MPQVKPPYIHVTQIGDPVLRAPTLPVEPQVIPLLQFQVIIQQMKKVMKKYNNVGLAAPQIGLPWQVFMIQIMEKHMKEVDESIRNIRGMELVPLQVFINPTMKTIDHKMISFPESCASFLGYNAVVPRAKAVEITALNDKGETFTASFKDWTARIVQHEMDHLKGILYTDRMDRKTLACSYWNEINLHEGNIELRFD